MMPKHINRRDWRMATATVNCSATIYQTFSILERFGERTGQGNSRTFAVSRKVRTIPTTGGRVLSCLNVGICRAQIKGRCFVVDDTIEDAPLCGAASRVAAAMVFELRVHAAANVIEQFVQTLVFLQTTAIIHSGLVTWLHDPLGSCG
ncbi:hypothetical protein TNCV_3495321 [Trichonephila clavipes]|nr:hypothetical protein TNCV_3495321 [Trichonephila clavipes]